MDSWLSEYDELAADVTASSYQTFSFHLQGWLDLVNEHPVVGRYIAQLERPVSFLEWYTAAKLTEGSMSGSGKLNWPRDKKKRLALQFDLFREIASDNIDLSDFAMTFFFVDNDLNDMASVVADQVFRPFVRDLRRTIEQLDLPTQPQGPLVPASDRIVTLNHNSAEYGALTKGLKSIGEQIGRLNDYPDLEAKERHTAELSAAERLLKSTTVRVAAFLGLVVSTLKWLSVTFAEEAIGIAAAELLKLIGTMFGFG